MRQRRAGGAVVALLVVVGNLLRLSPIVLAVDVSRGWGGVVGLEGAWGPVCTLWLAMGDRLRGG